MTMPVNSRTRTQNRRWIRGIALTTLCVITVSMSRFGWCADQVLQWKWQNGQAFDVALVQHIDAHTSYTGKSVKLTVDMEVDLGWEVKQVTGDPPVASLAQSIRRIRVKFADGQGTTKAYDSTSKRNPVDLAGTFDRFVGITMTVRIDSSGKIVAVDLPPEAKAALESAGPQQIDFSQLLRQSSPALPATAVAEGSSWMAELDTAIPAGRLKLATTYLHAGEVEVEETVLQKITHTSALQLASGKDESKLEVKEHDQKGSVLFDASAGRVVSSKSTQLLKTQSRLRETVIDTTTRSSLELTVAPSN